MIGGGRLAIPMRVSLGDCEGEGLQNRHRVVGTLTCDAYTQVLPFRLPRG